jgi:hypothetical protein
MQAYSSLCENRRSGDRHSDLGKCCVLEGREGDRRGGPLTGERRGIEIG